MIAQLLRFALKQRFITVLMGLTLIGVGLWAFLQLKIEAYPDISDTQVVVISTFPGHAAEEIEQQVTVPIERSLNSVPNVIARRSRTIFGLSVVELTFAYGTNDYFARQQVMERLQTVNLPQGIQATLAPLTNAVGEIYRYVIEAPKDMPPREVRALQDWVLRPALRQVSGVADVVGFGGAVKEYQVRLNPAQLRKLGVTADQVAQAIGGNSANAGGGLLRRGDEALVVRGVGILNNIDEIGQIVVTARAGKPIFVENEKSGQIFTFYQTLIKFRKEMPLISEGDYKAAYQDSKKIYAFERQLDGQKLLVLNNFFPENVTIQLPADYQTGKVLISNYDNVELTENLVLQPYQSLAIHLD